MTVTAVVAVAVAAGSLHAERRGPHQRSVVNGTGCATGLCQRVRPHDGRLALLDHLLEQIHIYVYAAGAGSCRRQAGVAAAVQYRTEAHYVRLGRAQLGADLLIVNPCFFKIVDKVTAWPVRAEADRVEGPAQFGLVLRMTRQVPEFRITMSKLTLVAVFAGTALLEGTAQFRLVT